MKSFFLFLILWIPYLQADLDQVSYSDDDPYIHKHVHVISGSLNLSFHDGVSSGAKSIPIVRTYTSSGALERNHFDSDISFKKAGGNWLSQGGWSQFAHVTLFLEGIYSKNSMKAYVANSAGSVICYHYSHQENNLIILKPEKSENQVSGVFSARNCVSNSEIRLCSQKGEAWIYFPDGSRRLYSGSSYVVNAAVEYEITGGNPNAQVPTASCFYHLQKEILPTQHCYQYTYDKDRKLTHISLTNPSETKTFSFIDIEYTKTEPVLEYIIRTSDGKEIQYSGIEHEKRQYLDRVDNGPCHKERLAYIPGRKGIGARLQNVDLADLPDIRVFYYLPDDVEKERKWANKPDRKEFHIDKVRCIEAPVGEDGAMTTVASFEYFEGQTDIRNVEGFLTRYHYEVNRLTKIEYFGEGDLLYSSEVFYWDDHRLCSKAALDADGKVLFAKTFNYDEFGNVFKETTWGYFTGEDVPILILNQDGTPSGGESHSKFYWYLPTFNLPIWEEEESGIGYKYTYLPGLPLLTAKYTCSQNQIISREFYSYDGDHLLIEEVVDDGTSEDPSDLSNVSERKIKRFQLDPDTGLVQAIRELYWDPSTKQENLLVRTQRRYSTANQVIEEDVYDANEEYSYTTHTSYDEKGRVTCQTTPLGRKNTQQFDQRGRLLETKKVGATRKRFVYNAFHKPVESREIDFLGNETITHTAFDVTGRPVLEVNPQGHIKEQIYDAFGRCIKSFLPKVFDESHSPYTPCIQFSYDVRGNIISTISSNESKTRTVYNTYRKPILVIYPDETKTRYVYSKTGLLTKIVHPNLTEKHFTYDFLGRKTSEKAMDQNGQIFSSKEWNYSAFQLISYTDERGLKTDYFYDGSGRKIRESAENRSRVFYYDALGFLSRVEESGVSHVQICNEEGEIIKQWDEDVFENRKDQMSFVLNDEGLKTQARRLTSQGEAVDFFEYDGKGRLSKHINPLGEVVQYIVDEFHTNEFAQQVMQKVTIDSQNNQSIETYNTQAHLVQREKQNAKGCTVAKEEFFYDGNGNQTSRVSYVFKDSKLVKKLSVSWEYDPMGRKTRQIEDHQKQTEYEYDLMGRLKKHTLPNKVQLLFSYDALGRQTTLASSDRTLHYEYNYEKGPEPTEMIDLLKGKSIRREYNRFGELVKEIGFNEHQLSWDYDSIGRCTSVHLPDRSSINYQYEGFYLSKVLRQNPQQQLVYEHSYQEYTPTGQVTKEQCILGLGEINTCYDLLERPSQSNNSWFSETLDYNTLGLVENLNNDLFGNKSFSYDALHQLKQEDEKLYEFDSLGNSGEFVVGACNQILETPDYELKYDLNGNPIEKRGVKGAIEYKYDVLGRLTSIIYPDSKKVEYFYDPLSRLVSKTIASTSFFWGEQEKETKYLYDHSFEIGTINSLGEIQELKVLGGRGLGDIGSAIAIELDDEVYLPIHDFRGNIVLLISQNGEIAESYEYSAFSEEVSSQSSFKNPWRFCSKRSEDGLVLFGERFYDPSLKRWLTPDPAGFADGINLYVYVLNNPVNRLDLFGLHSSDLFDTSPFSIYAPSDSISSYRSTKNSIVIGEAYVNDVRIDVVMHTTHWQRLKITPAERESGKVNLVDHLTEILPNSGRVFGLIVHGNGINTSLSALVESVKSIARKIHEGTFIMGLYNETNGIVEDSLRAKKEIKREITERVTDHAQILGALVETVSRLNSEMLMALVPHSEYGAIAELTPQLLSPHQKGLLKKQVYVMGIAPALPVSDENYFRATNVYSKKDRITKKYSKPYMNKAGYDISIIPCRSSWSEYSAYYADHAFLGTTYQYSMRDDFDTLRDQYRFYDGKNN